MRILESLRKELDSISDTVRDLIDQQAEKPGFCLTGCDTLLSETGGERSISKKTAFSRKEVEGILAGYADDTLREGWKDLVMEWWQVRNAAHRSKAVKSKRAFKTSVDALVAAKFLYGDDKANALLDKAVTKGWIGIEASWAENIRVEKTLKQVIEEKPAASLKLDALETQVYNWYNSLPPGDQKASVERAVANPEENEAEFVVFQKMGLIK